MTNPERAVVLLSGGLDSATALAVARDEGYECHCLSFDYGQRCQAELAAAARVAKSLGAVQHKVFRLDFAGLLAGGGSALTDPAIPVPVAGDGSALANARIPAPETATAGTGAAAPKSAGAGGSEGGAEGDIPITYVPARNTVFLAIALGWAEALGAGHVFIGVNAVDYSGYPDCRPQFIEAFQRLAERATKAAAAAPIRIRAPLLHLDKAAIIRAGVALGVDYGLTVSCYQAVIGGSACGRCDSCRLRLRGFQAAGIPDPAPYANA